MPSDILHTHVSTDFFVCLLPAENELHKLFTGGTVGLEQGLALSRPSVNIFLMILVRIPAAAAKLLHSCLTLCDPIDGSPPGSPVPGILQAGTLECAAISFSR